MSPRLEGKRVAVVAARGLGDALLASILSYNMRRAGHQVTLFSTVLCGMSDWFPGQAIEPFENFSIDHFDLIFAADHAGFSQTCDNRLFVLRESAFDKSKSMVENLRLVARREGLEGTGETGLVVPSGLGMRRHGRRVVLHPTSADKKKNWSPSHFRRLAIALGRIGYDPVFCVAPHERIDWPEAPEFPTLSAVAGYIYESGYLIGNDSGLGHLASLLGVPTLSLFARRSYARLWRPGWTRGIVVTPRIPCVGARMKERYWKNFLTVSSVLKNFNRLVKIP